MNIHLRFNQADPFRPHSSMPRLPDKKVTKVEELSRGKRYYAENGRKR